MAATGEQEANQPRHEVVSHKEANTCMRAEDGENKSEDIATIPSAEGFSTGIKNSKQGEETAAIIQGMRAIVASTLLGHPDLPDALYQLGKTYTAQYKELENLKDLESALVYSKAAVDGVTLSQSKLKLGNLGLETLDSTKLEQLAQYQEALAASYTCHFEKFGELDDLNAALTFDQLAVENTPAGHPLLPQHQASLAVSYTDHFRRLGNVEDLEAALRYDQSAVDNTPLNHPDLSKRQAALAISYTDCFQALGKPEDLEAALKYSKLAVENTPADHPDISWYQAVLATTYTERFERFGNLEDLSTALVYEKLALDNTPPNHPKLSWRQSALGITYTNVFHRLGEIEDLKAALKYNKLAVDNTPADHPNLPQYQAALAVSYTDYYREFGDLKDLEAALKYKKLALDNTPVGHYDLPHRQASFAVSCGEYFHRLGKAEDIEAALKYGELAVKNTPADHPQLPGHEANLAMSYTNSFQKFGKLEDLEAAVKYGQLAIEHTPTDHPDLPHYQVALAMSYTNRFQRLGNLKDLELALKYDQLAVENTPADDPNLPWHQACLAISYKDCFQRLGNLEDLEASLRYGELAVNSTPAGHPDLPRYQATLAVSYMEHYRQLGQVEDLKAALKYKQLALDGTLINYSDYHQYLASLAISYTYYFQKFGTMESLEAALKYGQQALDSSPIGSPEKFTSQATLATLYTDCFKKFHKLEDLESALKYNKLAIDNTPTNHPDLPWHQASLAELYMAYFKLFGDIKNVEAALELNQLAIGNMPVEHPDLPEFQAGLAVSYNLQYKECGNPDDHIQCLAFSQMAINSTSSSPSSSWKAALTIAGLHFQNNISVSLQAYKKAFEILPDLMWIGSSLATRHNNLIEYNIINASSSAASAAIHLDQCNSAVEFIEQGLSITHQQSLQLQGEYDDLKAFYPEEAAQLQRLSAQLLLTSHEPLFEDPQLDPHMLTLERNKLIKQIRTYEGFHDFLSPPLYDQLSLAATEGPIILLNCGDLRSDAIVILQPSVPAKSVHLPDVTPVKANEWLQQLQLALRVKGIKNHMHSRHGGLADASSHDRDFQIILKELWLAVVKPIFDFLHQNNVDDGRIWWCTSGLFSYLPIHAAAPTGSPYIQSYTSTLRGLLQARKTKPIHNSKTITVVGITETLIPGYSKLPLIHDEVHRVISAWQDYNIIQLLGSDGNVENVLKHMKTASWLHLACHGLQDTNDALKSGLLLSDGILELGQILNTSLPHAKFVFLSACETAMGDAKLINESMHLAGGFITAGFQGAIGTLWSMEDSDGPRIAEMVYSTVCRSGNSPDVTLAAEGLHLAIQNLRKTGAPFYRWIPFVHFGI